MALAPRCPFGQITARDNPSCYARIEVARNGQAARPRKRRAGSPASSTGAESPTALSFRAPSTTSRRRRTRTGRPSRASTWCSTNSRRAGTRSAQSILGAFIDHRHDAASAYYRSRPLLLSLGLDIDDALGSPLGRAGGFSDGRDIGVVCNLPNRDGPIVIPMSGDVGSQYTPCAGWAQSIQYHADVLGEADWKGAIGVVLGGEASVATNGFWSALTMATTLSLPMLFYVEDNGLGISVRGDMQTPGADIAKNLASFQNLFIRNGDGTNPGESARLIAECVAHVRGGKGPALVRLTVPRLNSHSGPDNQRGYRTDAEIAADAERDPLPRLRAHLVPAMLSEREWTELEAEVARDVQAGLDAARARPNPDPAGVARWVYADDTPDSPEAFGGLSRAERATLDGSDDAGGVGRRRTIRRGGASHAASRARGESEGVGVRRGRRSQGRRSPRHRRVAETVRQLARVRHEPVRRRHHRARGGNGDLRADASCRDPVSQIRRSRRRATEQLRHDALADGESLRGADRRSHAWRIRQGRRRPVAQSERRGSLRPCVRLAGGDSVQRGRRRGTASLRHARCQSDDLLRASLAADDERRQLTLSGRRLRHSVRFGGARCAREATSRSCRGARSSIAASKQPIVSAIAWK